MRLYEVRVGPKRPITAGGFDVSATTYIGSLSYFVGFV